MQLKGKKRVGQVGRAECDDMGVHRTDGDGTCIRSLTRRRLRGSESQRASLAVGSLRVLAGVPLEQLQDPTNSSVRLWLGPLCQFPSHKRCKANQGGAAGLVETCEFLSVQGGRLHNRLALVGLKRAVLYCSAPLPWTRLAECGCELCIE